MLHITRARLAGVGAIAALVVAVRSIGLVPSLILAAIPVALLATLVAFVLAASYATGLARAGRDRNPAGTLHDGE